MSFGSLLDEVLAALTAAGIPCMLTGSLAAAVHGAGRATMDIDLVIDPAAEALEQFVRVMASSGRYVSEEAAREALAMRTMFKVIDLKTGWKIDLIIRKDRPFSVAEFARRSPLPLAGTVLPVATVEDLILAKLEWAHLGGSHRQLDDVRSLIQLAGPTLDSIYLEGWTMRLGVQAEWARVRAEPDDRNRS